ncbi:short-chain dehydrogenase [Sarocladium strictum]
MKRKVPSHHIPPLPDDLDLSGKTAFVAGSNVGLGLECARHFLKLRLNKLIMAVRSKEKGEAAAAEIRSQFPDADVQVWTLDLESYQSIQAFAGRCEREAGRIDIAILNAALTSMTHQLSQHGSHREINIQVNYLGTALLALLLLPSLKPTAASDLPGRLTLISSDGALGIKIEDPPEDVSLLNTLDKPDNYDPFRQQFLSKLLLTMFCAKIADLVNPQEVIINCCNPGLSRGTELFRHVDTWPLRAGFSLLKASFSLPAAEAAKAYIYASIVLGNESHGAFTDWRIRAWPAMMYTDVGHTVSSKLWDETMEELGFADPEALLGMVQGHRS